MPQRIKGFGFFSLSYKFEFENGRNEFEFRVRVREWKFCLRQNFLTYLPLQLQTPTKTSHSNLRLQLNQPGNGHLTVSAYVKEHISEIASQNTVYYTPSPQQKTSGAESYRLPVTDSCIISIFHTIFVIPQAHSYVPSVAITSILVSAKILGVKFLNQHYKSPQCFALLSPLEQKFYQAVTRGSFRHIRNSHSIGTAYLRTRM